MKKQILSVLVENQSGVLARVSGLFSRRGYNIESLVVGRCESPDISRMTIVACGDEAQIEQVKKQLNKLIEVIKVTDITEKKHVERELALIKVNAEPGDMRSEIMQIAGIFRAKVIDVGPKTVVLEITGDSGKVDAIEELLGPYGITEMVRTGKVALQRGSATVLNSK
ncbi:acetolactate synthase small subunit [Methanoplanus limicola]|uniref:Acetolactate synthase small subunit n=1 Tax=Methanoplanus limicola DSM 2279 TaxID=937775 RepID=H1Z009_9EURY|nr:acetolactate synthase small subunit [Methanoplanus limicola]EHQ35216.1 acetolactate synthase, small subunit [Methanoplanus limicola DSM 2279]